MNEYRYLVVERTVTHNHISEFRTRREVQQHLTNRRVGLGAHQFIVIDLDTCPPSPNGGPNLPTLPSAPSSVASLPKPANDNELTTVKELEAHYA